MPLMCSRSKIRRQNFSSQEHFGGHVCFSHIEKLHELVHLLVFTMGTHMTGAQVSQLPQEVGYFTVSWPF